MAVYKKDNRWYTDLYDENGKRVRQVVKVKDRDPSTITRREAMQVESVRKADIATGVRLASTNKEFPFEKLVDSFLKWAEENHKAPERDRIACNHLLDFFKGYKADKVSLWHVEKYKSHRKAQKRKPETINKELGVLRRMYNLAVEWELINNNPIKGMKLLKVPKRQFRVLSEKEFNKLYQAAIGHFKPILLTAYLTGMRKGEIQKLKWDDVNFEDGFIHLKDTKNNEDRTIPLNTHLLSLLDNLKDGAQTEYVFETPAGEPYKSNTAWKRAWTTALKKSGIKHCRFHDLRHTFCSDLIVGQKEDFATVMSLSGHKDIRMLKRYTHTKDEAKKAAINKLGKGLNLEILDTYSDTSTVKQFPKRGKETS